MSDLASSGRDAPDQDHAASLRRHRVFGLCVLGLAAGGFGVWSTAVTLQGAVATTGRFVVAGEVKKVQHPTGGVVGELLVREGDRVRAGDVVLRLDETIVRANHQIVARQIDELAIRALRLVAERDGAAELALSPQIEARGSEPDIAALVSAEARFLALRRQARDGKRSQLGKRVGQLHDEIAGLKAQQNAKQREAGIIAAELVGVEDLYRRNLIQLTRLSALQRSQASIEGQRGQIVAQIAQAEGKIAEIELQIIQIEEDHRADVVKELRDVRLREGELLERRAATMDQLQRIDMRAPGAGAVHQLAVHTVGGVLQAGEPAMLIVPDEDGLQLDVRIAPVDIDQIELGKTVRVKVQAGNQATNPELVGSVSRIGADISRDERNGPAFYAVRVELPRREIERLEAVRIIAGMQADVFIETVPRTPLDFLMKPVMSQWDRTFRER